MLSLRWHIGGMSSLLLALTVSGCGSSSTGGGAGGGPGQGGSDARASRDSAFGGGGLGAGGAGGTAGVDVAASQLDAAVDYPLQPVDAALATDGSGDAPLGTGIDGGATYAQIKSLIAARCAACHTGTGTAATRIDFTDSPDAGSTLYQRLLGPLVLETYCGENVDAGGDAARPRRSIVPADLASSFLYLKITGTEPSPGNPPAGCGVRMPRVLVSGVDGGAPTLPSCEALDGGAAANCLSAADIDLVRQWILEGAPQ